MDHDRLASRLEIHEQLARYARGVDRRAWDVLREVFTPDAVLDYSSAGIPVGTRDEVCGYFEQAFTHGIVWAQHYITNVEVDFDETGERAAVTALFYNPFLAVGMAEPSVFGGYYTHEFVRTDHGWKSRHVVEHGVFTRNPPPKPGRA